MCIRRVTTVGNRGLTLLEPWASVSNPHHTPAESSQPGEGAQVPIPSPSSHRWGLFLMGISPLGCQQAQYRAQAARGRSQEVGWWVLRG